MHTRVYTHMHAVHECHVYICGDEHATAGVWRSKDSLQESVVSLYHVDLKNQTQVVRLYLLSHSAGPQRLHF